MYPLHVIEQVPTARKSIVLLGTITILEEAQIGFGSMSMHPVGFSLMTEKTGCGRKLNLGTSKGLATVRFEMRIQVFTTHCG